MHKRLRSGIMFFMLAIFLAAVPMVILQTAGYRYDWKKTRFEKTGLLVVDSVPIGADLRLNGELQKGKTPVTVSRLLPDDYDIRLEMSGRLPWEKTLAVNSGETTFARGIVLFQDILPRLAVPADATLAAVRADGLAAVLNQTDKWIELSLARPDGTLTPVARFAPGQLESPKLAWSPDGSRFLLTGKNGVRDVAYVYPAIGGDGLNLKIPASKTGLRLVRWNPDGSLLSAVTDAGALVIRAVDGKIDAMPATAGAEDAIIGSDGFFIIRKRLADEPDGDLPLVAGTVKAVYRISLADARQTARIADLEDTRYAFVDAAAGMVLIVQPGNGQLLALSSFDGHKLFQGTGDRVRWSGTPGKSGLLTWNDFEISTIDPATGRRDVIDRVGSSVSDCVWSPDGSRVFCVTADGVFAAELDDRGGRVITPLIRFPSITAFSIDKTGATIYLVGTVGNQRGLFERKL